MPQCTLSTPPGNLTVTEENGALISVGFTDLPLSAPDTPLLCRAAREFSAYFERELREFSLPIAPLGTAFQRSVWQAAREIPYGQTRTYGEIAAAIGRPGAARAVGGALHRNPLLLVIPCHRILGADGTLTGFGCGLERKSYLLQLESGEV